MCASPSSSSGPLCGIGGGTTGNSELKETKRSGWMSVLNCSPPTCNGGEEEFDFQMEPPADNNSSHKQTSASTDSHDDLVIHHNTALPKPPSSLKKSSSQRNKQQQQQQQQSVEFAYSDVYQNPDSATYNANSTQSQKRNNNGLTGTGNVPLNNPNSIPLSTQAPGPPITVPMFSNSPPSKAAAAPVVKTRSNGCSCSIM